jgi:membrane protein implicated in regulation of membrane protease activity
MNTQNIGWTVASVLFLILVFIAVFYVRLYLNSASMKLQTDAYNKGFIDGEFQIISAITSTGNIPFFENSTGNLSVRSLPLATLCGGK